MTMVAIIMGVTGSGKTTVGKLLAESLSCSFYDADDFHPEENVEKMRLGIPLNDEDRMPWLERLRALIEEAQQESRGMVLACSALKQAYRAQLNGTTSGQGKSVVRFIYLNGTYEVIASRLAARKGHYMNPSLLRSQFATLEEPSSDEHALRVCIEKTPEQIAAEVLRLLQE